MELQGYKKLIVWQKSVTLVVEIYALTEQFPKTEVYGLGSQMRRAAVSIPSNIAEGSRRRTSKDKNHFYTIAFGSATELETQLEILSHLPFGGRLSLNKANELLDEILKMLNTLTTY